MKLIRYISLTLFLECIFKHILCICSPTRRLARVFKEKEKWDKTCVIKELNCIYLKISISLILLVMFFANTPFDYSKQSIYPSIAVGYYLWSRSFEILTAFIIDAIDKTKPIEPSSSTLQPRDRIWLALNSYIELILIFALGYWLMPECWWGESAPKNMAEAVYFSGVTITTLGYGDIHPVHCIPQLLTVYEVLCGFSLIVVSFTIYTGLDEYKSEEDKLKEANRKIANRKRTNRTSTKCSAWMR